MMQSNDEKPENKPAKKAWQKPDFYIIDSNEINTGGNPGVLEKSFTAGGNINGMAPRFPFWYLHGQNPKAFYSS